MSKGRLTRQELGWLLTQEAQGAAERLRRGVQVLQTNLPPALPVIEGAPSSRPPSQPSPTAQPPSSGFGSSLTSPAPPLAVDASLAALDDVMRMLSSLHPTPSSGGRGRRGRIDLAALVYEVAPDARVSIEPGSGTEIYADEGEIRRMLHVLLGRSAGIASPGATRTGGGTGAASSSVVIRREGDDVRVAVQLGPDSSATADTERAWLHRMAIRYGGRHELEGGAEALVLPAGDTIERDERESLRRELDEARKQGEAYARELAAVFAEEEPGSASGLPVLALESAAPGSIAAAQEPLASLIRFAGGLSSELRSLVGPLAKDLAGLRTPGTPGGSRPPPALSSPPGVSLGSASSPPADDPSEAARRRVAQLQDLAFDLSALAEVDLAEGAEPFDLVEAVRAASRGLETKFSRGGIAIEVRAPAGGDVIVVQPRRSVALLLRLLLTHAIQASRAGGVVVVRATSLGGGSAELVVDDSGAALPLAARRTLLRLDLDPGTYGRPSSVPLYVAATIARSRGASLDLGDAPVEAGAGGGLRVSVRFAS